MSAKRAVEGRSQPYNVLLAAYQKKPIIKSIGEKNQKRRMNDFVSVQTLTPSHRK